MSEDQAALIAEISETLESVLNRKVELRPEMNIVNDLGLDSIAVMNFTMALEDRFDISIPLHDMASVVTVQDLLKTIAALRSEA
ncbi:MAG: acyl carrier protein [Ancylobacter novellus]|uniref:Acyl carrier protein n=1 Tax=Ancylobacter novellus TaxID=921 RepID=A0A2W5MNU3_ANCNO|nr:MAG: acyl carrier protein [Ancylobacter novellus]